MHSFSVAYGRMVASVLKNAYVAKSDSRLRHSRNAHVEELCEEDRGIGLTAGTGCYSPEEAK